jgi:hypothetical protein
MGENKGKVYKVMKRMIGKYQTLGLKEQVMLKNMAFMILAAIPAQDLGFLNEIAMSIVQMAIRAETESTTGVDEQAAGISQILGELLEQQVSSVRYANASSRQTSHPDQMDVESVCRGSNPRDCLPKISLFRVEYKQISFFLSSMFNILQNCAIDSQIGFEVIAKATQKIVNQLLSNALLQNAPDQDEHQLLLQVVVGDLCTLLSPGTFPLEFPIFTLFLKCLILDLIQFNYDYLLDQQSQEASYRNQEKGEMTLAHKVLVLDYI